MFALIAGGLGFTGIGGEAASIARILSFAFLVFFVVAVLIQMWRDRPT
ncbi:MAG: DUF1328 family protein [Patescibacteria group bacterium]